MNGKDNEDDLYKPSISLTKLSCAEIFNCHVGGCCLKLAINLFFLWFFCVKRFSFNVSNNAFPEWIFPEMQESRKPEREFKFISNLANFIHPSVIQVLGIELDIKAQIRINLMPIDDHWESGWNAPRGEKTGRGSLKIEAFHWK